MGIHGLENSDLYDKSDEYICPSSSPTQSYQPTEVRGKTAQETSNRIDPDTTSDGQVRRKIPKDFK
jgi:hypothetical protein